MFGMQFEPSFGKFPRSKWGEKLRARNNFRSVIWRTSPVKVREKNRCPEGPLSRRLTYFPGEGREVPRPRSPGLKGTELAGPRPAGFKEREAGGSGWTEGPRLQDSSPEWAEASPLQARGSGWGAPRL